MNEAERLLADYNEYWFATARIQKLRKEKGYMRGYKPTKARIELFQEMSVWCRERGIDPRLWLYGLFRARRWLAAPQLRASDLMSEKMISKYHELKLLDGYRLRLRQEHDADDQTYDPNRDLNPTVESRKRYYVSTGQTSRCMLEMAETLGFHPKSVACAGCSEKAACRSKLEALVEFNIVALRNGEITQAQAMAEVSCVRK